MHRSRPMLVFDVDDRLGELVDKVVTVAALPVTPLYYDDFVMLAERIESDPEVVTLLAMLSSDIDYHLANLAIVHEEFPAIPIVLVLPPDEPVDTIKVVRTGAIELLYEGVSADDATAAMVRSIHIGTANRAGAQSDKPAANIIAITSPVGGVGRTTLAANAAAWFAHSGRGRIALLDLGDRYGSASTALRLRSALTVVQAIDAAITDPEELDEHLSEYVVPHDLGFDLLTSGDDPRTWSDAEPEGVEALLKVLSDRYDIIVVDTPVGVDGLTATVVSAATTVAVVSRLDVPAMRALRMFLRQLDDLGVDRHQIQVVLNQTQDGVGLEVADVMSYLDHYSCRWIPFDRMVARSTNAGSPVVVANSTKQAARSLVHTIDAFADGAEGPAVGSSGGEPTTAAKAGSSPGLVAAGGVSAKLRRIVGQATSKG